MKIRYWKKAFGFEGYIVDCFAGELYSIKTGSLKKRKLHENKGYARVNLSKDNKQVFLFIHRLIWMSYHEREIPDSLTIDHIDNDCKRNHINNLQLMSLKDNTIKGNRGNHKRRLKIKLTYSNGLTKVFDSFQAASSSHNKNKNWIAILLWKARDKGLDYININKEKVRYEIVR